MPGLWAKSLARGMGEAGNRCFSSTLMFLSLPSPLSENKSFKRRRTRRRTSYTTCSGHTIIMGEGKDVAQDPMRPEATLPSAIPPLGLSASWAPPPVCASGPQTAWSFFPTQKGPFILRVTQLETGVLSSPPPFVSQIKIQQILLVHISSVLLPCLVFADLTAPQPSGPSSSWPLKCRALLNHVNNGWVGPHNPSTSSSVSLSSMSWAHPKTFLPSKISQPLPQHNLPCIPPCLYPMAVLSPGGSSLCHQTGAWLALSGSA